MKLHILTLIATSLLLLSCQSDPVSNESQPGDARARATAADPSEREGLTPIDNPRGTASNRNKAEPELGQRQTYQPPKTGTTLTLSFPDRTAKAGGEVCLPLQATGFTDLLSNQYTVTWDPKVLRFKDLKEFGLPGLGLQNFGRTRVSEGIMPVVWIDNTLSGVTLADGQVVYSLCFELVGQSGQSTEVTLAERPTPFEVVNLEEKLLDLKPGAGKVTVE